MAMTVQCCADLKVHGLTEHQLTAMEGKGWDMATLLRLIEWAKTDGPEAYLIITDLLAILFPANPTS